MYLVQHLKAAYDICCGSEGFSQMERDYVHFYLAVRSIVHKLTRGDAPDIARMNAKVQEMIKDALASDGVEEIFKLGADHGEEIDIFADDYLAKIEKIKLLQQLLAKAIGELGIDFEEKAFYDILKALTGKYDFEYAEDKLLHLARLVKKIVDDKARYTDLSQREDIKAELKVDLIIALAENDYPAVDRDEVYKEIFEQAENFKRFHVV